MRKRAHRGIIGAFAAGACAVVASPAFAGPPPPVPQGLTEQGRLFDQGGAPLAGTVSVAFTIYDAPAGGTALWTETQSITLDGGYFSAVIGAGIPIPTSVWTGGVRYVGIRVGADPEMTPRQPTESVPYALVAGDVLGAIHPASVSVNGQLVIDASGNWVGPSSGLVGPTGPQGAAGANGAQGAQGVAGATGAQGNVGPTGPTGAQGNVGPTGAQGNVGPMGATGPQGAAGAVGAQGPLGPAGAIGPTGPQGAAGNNGATGATGAAGATGAQGVAGATGAVGPQGAAGAAGAVGPQGPAGAAGANGAVGATGPQGAVGPTGPAGASGASCTVGGVTYVHLQVFLNSSGALMQCINGSAVAVSLPVAATYNLGFSASTFDVSNDGSLVAVAQGSGNIQAACFKSDGTVDRAQFTVSGSSYNAATYQTFFGIDVARAGTGKQIAITWNYGNFPSSPNDWQTWRVILDANCVEVAPAHLLDPGGVSGVNRPASVRASDAGSFAFLYEAQTMSKFRLIQVGATDQVIATNGMGSICENGALGRAIGMNRATGDVVTACENGLTKYYQRFSAAGAAVDASPVAVPSLNLNSGPWSLYFFLDYNKTGQVAFTSVVDSSSHWATAFFNTSMSVVSTTAAAGSTSSNDRVLSISTGDFIVPVVTASANSERYTSTGTFVSQATVSGNGRYRIDANDRLYVLNGNQVIRSALPW